MKKKFISKKVWDEINETDGSISLFDDNPIPALQNSNLKSKTVKVAISGGEFQCNPGADVYRKDKEKIDKDWYMVRKHNKNVMEIIGPMQDSEHHLGKIPKRVLKGKKK